MSVLVGKCKHGVIVYASSEWDESDLREAAYSYDISAVNGRVQLGGLCPDCEQAVEAKIAAFYAAIGDSQ